jgi:hypothetical protein
METRKNAARIVGDLRALAVPIGDLVPDPANARLHNERNIGAIEASLSKFGQRSPIVVQKRGMVVRAGSGRLEAARNLGWTEIAAIVVDESDREATAFAIADNRTAELATWDSDVLPDFLFDMRDDDDGDLLIGWSVDDLALMKIGGSDSLDPPGDVPDDKYLEQYGVIVICADEAEQEKVFAELRDGGRDCRVVTT